MRKRSDYPLLRHWDFILLDLLCLQLSFCLVYWSINGPGSPYGQETYRYQAAVLTICQLVVLPFAGGYDGIVRRDGAEEVGSVFRLMGMTLLLALVYLFVVHNSVAASRLQYGFTSVLFILLDLALRDLLKRRIRASKLLEKNQRALVLITSPALVRAALDKLASGDGVKDFRIVGIVLLGEAEAEAEVFSDYGLPVMPMDEAAVHFICHDCVDEVFLLQPEDGPVEKRLVDAMMEMGIDVSYANPLMEGFTEIRHLGGYEVLSSSSHFVPTLQLLCKRAMDIAGGLVGCVLTGVLFLFLAPAIYRRSPGPIFFAQERVGKNGRRFMMYKFRSMYMDAEKRKADLLAKNRVQDGMMFKLDDDPRIIGSEKKDKNGKPCGIGNFIRRTSLDEFPQFYNVLRGDMSLVGTRPPTVDEWKKYDVRHRIRMSAKPGMTGLWQVSGRSKITDFEKVVELDRYYIEHWTIWMDIRILIRTVLLPFQRDGGAF